MAAVFSAAKPTGRRARQACKHGVLCAVVFLCGGTAARMLSKKIKKKKKKAKFDVHGYFHVSLLIFVLS